MSAMDELRYENALQEILDQLRGIDNEDLTTAEVRIRSIAESVIISVHRAQEARS
jgi:hypothetical protein